MTEQSSSFPEGTAKPDSTAPAEPAQREDLPSDFQQMMLARMRELQTQISEAREQIAALQETIDAATQEGRALREAALTANHDLADAAELKFFASPTPSPHRRKSGKPRAGHEQIVEWLLEIFAASGKPELQVQEILSEMESNPRYKVPGAGTTSNISVHLGRSPVFEPAARKGTWRLANL